MTTRLAVLPTCARAAALRAIQRIWANEATVSDGVFRANHPSANRLGTIAKQGIRVVLDLDGEPRCRKLAQRCKAAGLRYVHVPIPLHRSPERQELWRLVEALGQIETPALLCCATGAGRTGFAAALWALCRDGLPLSQAKRQLSPRHMHNPELCSGRLDAVLDQFGDTGAGAAFEQWVETTYDPGDAEARFRSTHPPIGLLKRTKAHFRGLYRYAQEREGEWHRSFERPIETAADRRRAEFFIRWIDHGVLRGIWTNEAEVIPGVIRSNHPTEQRLRVHAARGLKSLINLRGEVRQPQYLLERRLCDDLGVTMIDIPMNAYQPPPAQTALAFLDAVQAAEKPVLFHCKSGADRTGIASALLVLDQGLGVEEARAQLSLRFLHMRNGKKGVLDDVLEAYAHDTVHTPMSIREWLVTAYDPDAIAAGFRARRGEG